ncbi:MAG: helix-turn-helix domain containing protein [Planctomycetia bacterium]|nr:helix-turn-helix domain containing protein [Planctomycetia bacterium]
MSSNSMIAAAIRAERAQFAKMQTDSWLKNNDETFDLPGEDRVYYKEADEAFFSRHDARFALENAKEYDPRPACVIDINKLFGKQKESAKLSRYRKNTPVFLLGSNNDDEQIYHYDEREQHVISIQKYGSGKNLDIALLLLRKVNVKEIAERIGRSVRTVRNAKHEIKVRVLENVLRLNEDEANALLDMSVHARPASHGGRGRKKVHVEEQNGQCCLFDFASEKLKRTRRKRPKAELNNRHIQLDIFNVLEVAA